MKPRAQKITVIIVFLLVLLFGVGQFFARAPLSVPNPQGTAAPAAAQTTQVVQYAPPTPASSTPVVDGSCWTNSIAAPFRADAWRCAVGNGIQDPCFQIGGSTSTLLCGIDPKDATSSKTFVLSLTKPLPVLTSNSVSPPGSDWAWLVELADGTLCSPFTGTLPFAQDGEVALYSCAPRYKGDDRMIFGNFDTSADLWTAEVGTLSASTSTFPPPIASSSTVPVVTVWQ
ncbi:MAG: hypothetical protein WCF77_04680 [Minisyncoccia bacterium]|jgi:hypothetical protein